MEAFSVERVPLLQGNEKWLLSMSYALIFLSLVIYLIDMWFVVFGNEARQLGVSFIVFMGLFLILPLVHRMAFREYFEEIKLSVDASAVLLLLALVTIMVDNIVGCGGGVGCTVYNFLLIIYFVINGIVMGSTCNHYYSKLFKLTLIEMDSLLSFDERRTMLHKGFCDHSEELLAVKASFEKVIGYEIIFALAFAVYLYHAYKDLKQNNPMDLLFNTITMIFISYRNFLHGCLWNSLLLRIENVNALTLEKIKIKCFGVTVTYELVVTLFLSVLSFLCRDLIAK